MNKLYEALEICLKEIEHGADVDTVLFHYPELAEELRPILEASVKAKAMAVPAPTQEMVRRNKAKLLQHAAEMREQKAAPVSRRIWSVPFRRALVAFLVIAFLFVSSTGLVRASSVTLPGESLYPVKRTWEDLRLLFAFNTEKRDALELEFENERLEELDDLVAEGRSAEVEFSGYVTRQNGTEWRVSGITVFISPDTRLPDQQVQVGNAVEVKGRVQDGGSVAADEIKLLPADSILPEVKDDDAEFEQDKPENANEQIEDNSGKGSEGESTDVPSSGNSTSVRESDDVSLEGVVGSIENNFIVVDGVVMDIRLAEIKGTPHVGVIVKVEGYYDNAGVFIVTRIEFKDDGSNSGDGSGSGDDNTSNGNSNDNSNDNDNDNTNVNSNDDNSNSNSGNNNDNNNNGNDD